VIATLEDLDEDALVQILTEPKNALVKQYQRLFELEDVQLTFTDDALKRDRQEGHRAQDRRAWPALDHGGSCSTPCSTCRAWKASRRSSFPTRWSTAGLKGPRKAKDMPDKK
jgi:hypothetical protein